MNELIIDSSTNKLIVGLRINNKKYILTRDGNNDNSAYVIDLIQNILKDNNLTIDDLNTIIVGVGPGSYTGARVAVTVAKMLAYTKNILLKEISSLNLLSTGYENIVLAAIDARRKHYFAGLYNNGVCIDSDKYVKAEDILNNDFLVILNDETIKIDLDIISLNATIVEDIHNLEPNYLRVTEAERNYDSKINDWRY